MAAPAKKVLAQKDTTPDNPTTQPVEEGSSDERSWLRRAGNPAASSSSSNLPSPARSEYLPFARVLRDAMLKQKLSASEVARRIWGSSTDSRGYDVARNRDRIGHYLAGTSYPEPENLAKLADAVGVPVSDLAIERRPPPLARPPRAAGDPSSQPEDVQILYVGGDLREAQVILNKRFYGPFVERLIALLKENDAAGLARNGASAEVEAELTRELAAADADVPDAA